MVTLDDLGGDGEAETRAAGLAGARLVHAVEALENTAPVGLGNADAVVRNLHPDRFSLAAGGDADMAAVGRIFDGVAKDVEHDLLDAPAVAHDEGQIFTVVMGELVLVTAGLQLDGAEHRVDGGGEGKARHGHLAAAGVETRERQKVLHDMGHAVRFADDNVEKVVFRLAAQIVARLADGLGVGADVRQRRAQLVGDIGDEFLAPLLGLAVLGHVVQHDEHAAALLVGEGREVELHTALADRQLGFDKLASLHGNDAGEGADGFKQVAVDALFRRAAEQLAGGGVAVDERAAAVIGDDAVAHVEKERVELVALVLHGLERGVEDGGHVVEGRRQDTDLIRRFDGERFVKIAGRDALGALGQLLDGVDHRLGEQEGEKNGDEKAHEQCLQNDEQQLRVQR